MYTQNIFRFCLKMLNDYAAAEDVVQDSFLILWENRKKVNFQTVKPWLYTTAYRLCQRYLKKSQKTVSDDVLMNLKMSNTDYTDIKSVINDSLTLLTDTQKSVLLLKDYEGFKYHEIANILEISENSVKVHLFRGRQKIKNYIVDIKTVI